MSKELILEDIKKKFTGYDDRYGGHYGGYRSFSEENDIIQIVADTYPDELFELFNILCSILPDNITLDELLLNMELLIKDFENGKCGFHNNSDTKERFESLSFKFNHHGNLPVVLSYIPRFVSDVTDEEFSTEFSRRFGREILGEYNIEEPKQDYGYIEVSQNEIDISNKDKAEVLAGLYNNSHPMGMGMAQYDPTPMTIEVARKILEKTQKFSYLLGRPLYINLEGNIIFVGAYNRDNAEGLAQRVISNCKNINDIGKDVLKKVEQKVEEEIQKQIQEEIAKKHKEIVQTQDTEISANSRNNGLNYLRVSPSELQPRRRLIEESGYEITGDSLQFIKGVENGAYPEEMKMMQDIEDVEELEDLYNYYLSELTIARNNDWYIIYGEDEDSIEIVDIASLPTRDRAASQEIHNYITRVINQKAHNGNKPVTLNAKEDTSYRMIQRMVLNGEYEILEDEANTWEDNDEIVMHNLVLRPIMQRDRNIDELQ